MDMLEIGTGTMTEFEEQTHFAFWAALKSPLVIGADITKMNTSSLNILLNKELIAINQDDAGIAASYLPDLSKELSTQVWAGPLAAGSFAHVVLALNEGKNATDIYIPWSGIPELQTGASAKYKVRDVWAGKNLGTFTGGILLANVSSHQTKALVVSRA
jgi:alpha-galactosidase